MSPVLVFAIAMWFVFAVLMLVRIIFFEWNRKPWAVELGEWWKRESPAYRARVEQGEREEQ